MESAVLLVAEHLEHTAASGERTEQDVELEGKKAPPNEGAAELGWGHDAGEGPVE
jgi:hypothetical protein